jgi:tRNA(Phe) wybutosine-synthesizing methylase Tyw3
MALRTVIFKHKVRVDSCLADELEQLNNNHGIVTTYSCCGHGDIDAAYILVRSYDVSKMLKLGYKKTNYPCARIYTDIYDDAWIGRFWYHGHQVIYHIDLRVDFIPKSRCRCRRKKGER